MLYERVSVRAYIYSWEREEERRGEEGSILQSSLRIRESVHKKCQTRINSEAASERQQGGANDCAQRVYNSLIKLKM